ncbi:3-oxoacyl-[acyl-carrier-protein] synthase III C-terminal domain-containing protein, partial [Escherichia coli]|uniref:3-oxoacyl-[acyl-carrier-protein] synthase III C-terminal domain-containing protein n=1 Tax=Escherichia coli TaxID=562 RepID=UPI003D2F3CD4
PRTAGAYFTQFAAFGIHFDQASDNPAALIDVYRFYGNQVAASIPTALHEAVISGRFTADKPVMLIGTAA